MKYPLGTGFALCFPRLALAELATPDTTGPGGWMTVVYIVVGLAAAVFGLSVYYTRDSIFPRKPSDESRKLPAGPSSTAQERTHDIHDQAWGGGGRADPAPSRPEREIEQDVVEIADQIGNAIAYALKHHIGGSDAEWRNTVELRLSALETPPKGRRLESGARAGGRGASPAAEEPPPTLRAWLDWLEAKGVERPAVIRLQALAVAVELLDSQSKSYMVAVEKMLVQIGEGVFSSLDVNAQQQLSKLDEQVQAWASGAQLPMKITIPQLGDGFDAKHHMLSDGVSLNPGASRSISAVKCWGVSPGKVGPNTGQKPVVEVA